MTGPLTVRGLSTFARDLAGQADEPDTVARIAELAVGLMPCAAADVVRIGHCGEPTISASTDLARSEARTDFGFSDDGGSALLCRPLWCVPSSPERDEQTPLFRPVDSTGSYRYVLRFHPADSVGWTHGVVEVAGAFAEVAAIALDRAIFRDQAQSLALGLDSNRLIGTAIGILMANDQNTYDDSFRLLRACSQRTNRKLRQVAEDVILAGEIPDRLSCGVA